jgi:hypothetical protein
VTAPFGEGINVETDKPWTPANWFVQGGDGSINGLQDRTQDNVTAVLQGNMQGSPGWNIATQLVYAGLRTGIGLPLAVIEALANQILAPFGTDGEFGDIAEALQEVVQTLMQPWHILTNLNEFLENVFDETLGRIAGLEAKVNALNLSLDPDATETGGYDNCKTDAKFTDIVGSLTPTGWGALTASATAVALYDNSPTADRHGAGITVKAKDIGQTRLHICADTAMTNWVGLELNPTYNGQDTVGVITGTGPTTGITTRTSLPMRVPTNTFWEIRYEPFDEDSPTSNTFHVFMNGAEIIPLRWRDDGNIVIHGTDHLRVGITLNGLNSPTRRGFAVTDFTYYDWLSASPQ